MVFKEKTVILKTGETCILKTPSEEDAKEIKEHLKITSDETKYMIRYGEEVVMTVDEEREFLKNNRNSATDLMICAVVNGKIAANAGFGQVAPRIKTRHRATFGISIKKDYWNKGIGTIILKEIIAQAKAAGYEQLELDVVSENERAHHVYLKSGFKDCGILPHAFKFKDGTYGDLTLMYLDLTKI